MMWLLASPQSPKTTRANAIARPVSRQRRATVCFAACPWVRDFGEPSSSLSDGKRPTAAQERWRLPGAGHRLAESRPMGPDRCRWLDGRRCAHGGRRLPVNEMRDRFRSA